MSGLAAPSPGEALRLERMESGDLQPADGAEPQRSTAVS